MRKISIALALSIAASAPLVMAQAAQQNSQLPPIDPNAWRIVELANLSRSQEGLKPLKWDPSLTQAALAHCQRMIEVGQIAHRYGDELNVGGRAAQAGAHFSLIAENIAIGPNSDGIHVGWMNSPEHRENILNPKIDRIGVAVVQARGVFYAVADYSRSVPVLDQSQVESKISDLIRGFGIKLATDPADARAACAMEHGFPDSTKGPEPLAVVRWQDSETSTLPPSLIAKLKSGQYLQASVGNCPAQGVEGAFTLYRFAVLLYGEPPRKDAMPLH